MKNAVIYARFSSHAQNEQSIEGVIADNQAEINNLMQVFMHGKIANTILAQIEKLENENAELTATIESEKALQIDY